MKTSRDPIPFDIPLLSSPATIKQDDEKCLLWRDVKNWAEDRIKIHQEALEVATDMSVVVRSQAIIGNLRDLLELPEQFTIELNRAQKP